jgi:hypothetical protein
MLSNREKMEISSILSQKDHSLPKNRNRMHPSKKFFSTKREITSEKSH